MDAVVLLLLAVVVAVQVLRAARRPRPRRMVMSDDWVARHRTPSRDLPGQPRQWWGGDAA